MRRIRPWKFRPVFTYNTGMGTYILDRKQAAALAPDPAEYNVMIRITNPRGEFLQLEHEHSFRDILSLRFYDIDDEDSPLYLFNETHLEQCLRFFEKHRNCRNMIVHCDEGRSRSAGVAIGWFLFNGNRSAIYTLYHDGVHTPNRRVVELFFRHFGEDLRRIDRWEKELYG
jgi:predicted protein tyrosine phosphatase